MTVVIKNGDWIEYIVTYTGSPRRGHGKLIDDFIIPANLKAGDTFLNQNLGTVTISRFQQRIYKGAARTVLYASTNQSSYVWDQITGVTVQTTSQQPDYSIHTIDKDPNLWPPLRGFDTAIKLLIGVTLVIVIVVVGIVAVMLRKKKTYNKKNQRAH